MKILNILLLTCSIGLTAPGCNNTVDQDSDDTSTDTGTETDSETDSGTEECGNPWGWYDELSDLCFENPPTSTYALVWEDAIAYCDELVQGGHDDWRLPSISELRSFVRGCDALMTGGECGVTDECYEEADCWIEESCSAPPSCETGSGPGVDGMFWDSEIIGGGAFVLWSSTSTSTSGTSYIWTLRFSNMIIYPNEATSTVDFRCVRNGL